MPLPLPPEVSPSRSISRFRSQQQTTAQFTNSANTSSRASLRASTANQVIQWFNLRTPHIVVTKQTVTVLGSETALLWKASGELVAKRKGVGPLNLRSRGRGSAPGRVTIKQLLLGQVTANRYIAKTKVNSAFHPSGIGKSSTGLSGLG